MGGKAFLAALLGLTLSGAHAQGGGLILLRTPADTSTLEDAPITLFVGDLFRDPLGKTVVYSAQVDPSHGEATVSGGFLTYRPAKDFSQPDFYVFIEAVAEGVRKGSTRFVMSVHPVNDPPRITENPVPLGFHNNDSFSVDLSRFVTDVEHPAHLKLEWDSLPGFDIRAEGWTLSGCAPTSITPSTLRFRAKDPDGAVSAYAELRLDPNRPAQAGPLPLAPLRAGTSLVATSALPGPDGTFEILSFTTRAVYLDRYREDGGKARPTRLRAFPPGDTLWHAYARKVGEGYLIIAQGSPGGNLQVTAWFADADFASVRKIEMPNAFPSPKAIDEERKVVYLLWHALNATGGTPMLKAYDFAMKPMPDPPFSDTTADRTEMFFDKDRILILKSQVPINSMKIPVKAYARDGWRFLDSLDIPLDHVPSEAGLVPVLSTVRLIPEGPRYLLVAGVWDYRMLPNGTGSLSVGNTHILYRRLDGNLQPLGSSLPLPSPGVPTPMPFILRDFRAAGSQVILWASSTTYPNDNRTCYVQAFDAELQPRPGPDTLAAAVGDYLIDQQFVALSGNRFLEMRMLQDRSIQGHVRSVGPSTGIPGARPRSTGGHRGVRMVRSGPALLATPASGPAGAAYDMAGKRRVAAP